MNAWCLAKLSRTSLAATRGGKTKIPLWGDFHGRDRRPAAPRRGGKRSATSRLASEPAAAQNTPGAVGLRRGGLPPGLRLPACLGAAAAALGSRAAYVGAGGGGGYGRRWQRRAVKPPRCGWSPRRCCWKMPSSYGCWSAPTSTSYCRGGGVTARRAVAGWQVLRGAGGAAVAERGPIHRGEVPRVLFSSSHPPLPPPPPFFLVQIFKKLLSLLFACTPARWWGGRAEALGSAKREAALTPRQARCNGLYFMRTGGAERSVQVWLSSVA